MASRVAKRQKLDDEVAAPEPDVYEFLDDAAPSSSSKGQGKEAELKKKKSPGKTKTPAKKTPAAAKAPRKPRETQVERVNRLLLKAGYKKPEESSLCARAGLIRGHFGFKFTGEAAQLDIVVIEGKCENCEGTMKATVRKLLKQADHGGDYEDGSERAGVDCDSCEARSYVTRCCMKRFAFDCGKFHNHCDQCPGLGKCIGDYRECHCDRCGKHYWGGGDGHCSCESGSGSDSDGGKTGKGWFW